MSLLEFQKVFGAKIIYSFGCLTLFFSLKCSSPIILKLNEPSFKPEQSKMRCVPVSLSMYRSGP